ncbi:MAG: tRNA lysidine(34) synthetase TilS, partial [Clostridia bacterium]|nr:tRNA lysidine(34) synthetase TilS [Clostridia bacterium]
MSSLPRAFLSFCSEHGLTREGAHLLVGFSGGADSTALLEMLHLLRMTKQNVFSISALHVHHGIRGAEADRDLRFCKDFCEERQISFTAMQIDAPMLAKANGLSLEEAARNGRYDCFSRHLDAHPEITHLLTAHHADDQAETILFRLLRGTAIGGLSGIPAVRDFRCGTRTVTLARPLLRISKEELLQFCEEHGLSYVTDSSNLETDCTRNRIRHELMPLAKSFNPALSKSLLQLAEASLRDEEYFADEISAVLPYFSDIDAMPLDRLRKLHPALTSRLLRILTERALKTLRGTSFAEHPITAAHFDAMLALIGDSDKPGSTYLPGAVIFSVFPAGNRCRFSKAEETISVPSGQTMALTPGIPVPFGDDSVCLIDDGSSGCRKNIVHLKNIYKFVISTVINSDTIKEGIFVRGRTDGKTDSYLCGGSYKRAKDALSAHKVP